MNIGAFQESHSHTMKTGMLLTYSLAYSSLSLIARRVWKCRSAHISRNEGVLLATAKKVNGSDKSSGAIAAIRVFTVGAIHHFAVHCECSGARSGTQYAGTTCSGDWYSTAAMCRRETQSNAEQSIVTPTSPWINEHTGWPPKSDLPLLNCL